MTASAKPPLAHAAETPDPAGETAARCALFSVEELRGLKRNQASRASKLDAELTQVIIEIEPIEVMDSHQFGAPNLIFLSGSTCPDPYSRLVSGWVTIAIELGVLPMALRILILVSLLTIPAAKPLHREAIPVGTSDVPSCKSSDVSPTDGHSHPLAGRDEDPSWSSPLLGDGDADESEHEVQTPALAIWQAGGIDLAISLFVPAHRSPLAAHFSGGRTPLRC